MYRQKRVLSIILQLEKVTFMYNLLLTNTNKHTHARTHASSMRVQEHLHVNYNGDIFKIIIKT